MGKGDRRTRRGKIYRGTYGITRPKKRKKPPEKPAEGTKPGKAAT
jgi:30S ribosomal protein S31